MGLLDLEKINKMKFKTQGIPHNVNLSTEKAKEILKHGEVHGKPLTRKQKGFFGARAGKVPIRRKK